MRTTLAAESSSVNNRRIRQDQYGTFKITIMTDPSQPILLADVVRDAPQPMRIGISWLEALRVQRGGSILLVCDDPSFIEEHVRGAGFTGEISALPEKLIDASRRVDAGRRRSSESLSEGLIFLSKNPPWMARHLVDAVVRLRPKTGMLEIRVEKNRYGESGGDWKITDTPAPPDGPAAA